jgi:hypothetical protein
MITNTSKLQDSLRDLIDILVDKSMWNFLTDKEREKVAKVIQQSMEVHE